MTAMPYRLAIVSTVTLNCSVVIAGFNPAIHLSKKMDARVKPAHDEESSRH